MKKIARAQTTTGKNGVTLRIDNVLFIAKCPHVQPIHTYMYKDESDILYLSYDWEVYTKRGLKWKRIYAAGVYEFGILARLEKDIQKLLQIDCSKNGVRHYIHERQPDGTILENVEAYQAIYTYNVSGTFNEDGFHFVKYLNVSSNYQYSVEKEYYDLTILIGGDESGKIPFETFFPGLTCDDVKVIQQFAHEFTQIVNRVAKAQVEKAMRNKSNASGNYPKIVRDYLYQKYNITNWRPIFEKICQKEHVLTEYIEYITGQKPIHELRCHEWYGEQRNMQQMLQIMPDYRAYMHIIDENRKCNAQEDE